MIHKAMSVAYWLGWAAVFVFAMSLAFYFVSALIR